MEKIVPGPGQESVWHYPRPPKVEPCLRRLRVEFNGHTVADTVKGHRLLETSHPPTYYIPRTDVDMYLMTPNPKRSFCEYKGEASYWDVAVGSRVSLAAAWSYPSPSGPYWALRDHFAFYPSRVDGCLVDDERVEAQEGDFYGGWITSNITGPFKGGAGTWGW